MTTIPIACTLGSAELATRISDLERDLFAHSTALAEIPGGIRHTFAASDTTRRALFAFIEAETNCCAFLTFRLTFEPGQSPISLDITGPAEALPLILETFARRR